MRHPRNQLLLLLLAALRLQRGFQPRCHLVDRVAGRLEFVRNDIADRRVEVSFLNPLHAGHQNIQRLLDVPEQVLCQIEIRKAACRQQRQNDRAAINCGNCFRAVKRRFQPFARFMQRCHR